MSADYVTFKLGLSLGEISDVDDRRGQNPEVPDAFTWHVTCDGDAVTVHALENRRVRQLARATWREGKLVSRTGSASYPNHYQWRLVTEAVGKVLHRPVAVEADAPTPITHHVHSDRTRASRRRTLLAIAGGAIAISAGAVVIARSGDEPPPRAPAVQPRAATPPAPPVPPRPAPPPSLESRVAAAPSFTEAIALAKPRLGDGADHAGAQLLARYANGKLQWRDVALTDPETTFGRVLKDSELERGKRMCATGKLLDIERRDLDRRPTYVGAMETAEGDVARFIAVGSTGDLVKRSTGTLCGVVTGKDGKAVMMVGLFDLPENRAPMVER